MFVVVTVAFLACVACGMLLASKVSLVSLLVVQLAASVFGMYTLASTGYVDWFVFTTYLIAVCALVVGRLVFGIVRPASSPMSAVAAPRGRGLSEPVVWAIVIVASSLSFYHLLAAGIPILSSNVEVERFDFTSSGLFGVPGRMYLFGLKIAWILASANATVRSVRWRKYYPWVVATASLVLTSLLSGFKGQIGTLVVLVVVAWCLTHRGSLTYGGLLRRFWPFGLAAVGYAILVASEYVTYQQSQLSVLQSLWNRVSIGSAEAPAVVLGGHIAPLAQNSLINDTLYFAARYAGVGPGAPFSLERMVSAAMIGADPATSDWLVPVTVGGYAELALAWGIPVALLAMALIGALFGAIETTPARGAVSLAVQIVVALATMSFLVKGGLVYHLVNWSSVALILLVVGYGTHLVCDRRPSIGTARGLSALPAAAVSQAATPLHPLGVGAGPRTAGPVDLR